jgi:hypothetical protein
MGPLEEELRQQLAYRLSGIEGIPELMLEALDKQDAGVFRAADPDQETVEQVNTALVDFCRESILRLAREIDELRASGTGREELG